MIPLDPLPNLIDQVYARILEAITDRSLPPGHRIRQNELAEKLGVSRQPVSHALHLLHRQGLVADRPAEERDAQETEQGRHVGAVERVDPVDLGDPAPPPGPTQVVEEPGVGREGCVAVVDGDGEDL